MAAVEPGVKSDFFGGRPEIGRSGVVWLAVAAAGIVAFFWIGLASLFEAWETPEYSHGYLIPPIALYLFLNRLQHIEQAVPSSTLPGVLLAIAGLLVGLLGNLVNIPDIGTYGLIAVIAGLVLICMGTWRGALMWASVGYLVFMLPLPNFIYWQLSIKLQMISSVLGVGLIKLIGVPVFLDGNVIDLGVYKLQVAEACSGLRYLFPLMSFGFLFAVLYKGPAWHRVILFLSTMPITVLMNSFRIGVIGVLVDRYGIEQAEGFLHFFEGWVIFVACTVVLYIEAALLQRLLKDRMPVHMMIDIDFSSLGSQFARIRNIRATRSLILVAVVSLIAGIAWHASPARETIEPGRDPLVLFPMAIGSWTGGREELEPNIEAVLAADDYLVATYSAADAPAPVNLFIAYYKSQTNGSGIHSPEVCIPAGGWEVSSWSPTKTRITSPGGEPLTVNRAIIQKGLNRQLVYYWFEQRGRSMTSDYAAKAYTVLDSVSRGRTDGALVRVVTPIQANEKVADGDRRLQGFLEEAIEKLPSFVPI